MCKHPFCNLPIILVNTIFYFRSFHFTLDQAGLLQFFQMLRNGCFGNRQFFVNVTEEATILFCQESKNGHPRRMSHCFGITSYLFQICCVLFIFHYSTCIIVCCLQNYEQILTNANKLPFLQMHVLVFVPF